MIKYLLPGPFQQIHAYFIQGLSMKFIS